MVNIGAAIAGSKLAAIGFNLAKTTITRTIDASVDSTVTVTLTSNSTATIEEAGGMTAGLDVSATDKSSIVTVSVGVAGAVGPR